MPVFVFVFGVYSTFYVFSFFLGDNKQMSPLQTTRRTKMKNDDETRLEVNQEQSNDVKRQERLRTGPASLSTARLFDDGEVIGRSRKDEGATGTTLKKLD